MVMNTHTINKRKTRHTVEESQKSRQQVTEACVAKNTGLGGLLMGLEMCGDRRGLYNRQWELGRWLSRQKTCSLGVKT